MRRIVLALPVLVGCGEAAPAPEGGPGADAPGVPAAFGSLSPLAPPETAHWGQLAGVWECRVSTPTDGGTPVESRATWTFRYILDGHAVQDVYEGIRADPSPSFFGTGLRTFHPATSEWEISWTANSAAAEGVKRITQFTATSTPDRIEMRRVPHDPTWSTVFHDITGDTFAWTSEPSGQTMRCRRVEG